MLTEPIAVTLMVVDVFIHKENAFEQSQFKRRASQAISTQPERAAYVAEQWGRRWITIDTSRVAIALARTRLMSGRYPYYLLADSAEGRRKEAELNPSVMLSAAKHPAEGGEETLRPVGAQSDMTHDIKRGFVYERVPHVTLKSIANNEEIDEIHAKYQPDLDKLRGEINKLAKQKWEEWEIPRGAPAGGDYESRPYGSPYRSRPYKSPYERH